MNGPVEVPPAVTTGAPPTPVEKVEFAAAANLSPEKSLTRIQELAKFVFASVSVVGTLLTGLGVFTDLGDVLEESWKLPSPFADVPVAVAALGLSLLFASFALWPKLSSIDLTRPAEVKAWYTRQIYRRGLWMTASLAFFSLAILVAAFTGSGRAELPKKPAISASWTGLGDEGTVKVTATAEDVPSSWSMITVVRGYRLKGKSTAIFRDRTRPNASGELSVSGEVGVGPRFKRIEATARFHAEGDPKRKFRGASQMIVKRH